MIEAIKKEIEHFSGYCDGEIYVCNNEEKTRKQVIYVNDLFIILDKYNNQPDYKSAWEELKKGFENHTEGWLNHEDQSYMYSKFENLEQKYSLEKGE